MYLSSVLRNKRKAGVLTLYVAVTALVVVLRYRAYAPTAPSVFVPIARAAAAGIYLNFGLILIPMMRLALSRSSHRWLNVLLPVHKAIESHQIAGHALIGFSVVHVAAYIGLYGTHGFRSHPANVTGIALAVLLGVLWWGAMARGKRRFEVFYYTHFLGIPILGLGFLHAPWFVWLMTLPLVLYLVDRGIRAFLMSRVAVIEHLRNDGRDIDLFVHRPVGFTYAAGDYAFLCFPDLSRAEWHPFSLVNAPSERGSLSFRIRRTGDWTERLSTLPVGSRVYIDGPFSSPCRDLHHRSRTIIVAAGIGITPFVSFLADLANRVRAGERPHERIELYWLERDEASFSAFRGMLEGLAQEIDGFRVHLVAKDGGEPVVWDDELRRLASEPDMAGGTVFFCGPRPLSEVVRVSSRRFGLSFRTESF